MPEPAPPKAPIPVLLMAHSLGHGGGERQLALTALHMDRSRFEPHAGCCEEGFWTGRLRAAGVPIFQMGPRSLRDGSALKEAWRLRKYIRAHRIRIVQTFDYSMNVLAIPVALTVPGVAALSNLRCAMELIPAQYRRLNHLAHRFSRAVVVNSAELQRELREDYNIAPGKIQICFNGIDTAVFHPGIRRRLEGLEQAEVVVGVVCVLRPEKNLPLLLEAFRDVAETRRGIRLLIVGSGPEEAALRSAANKYGLAERCVFRPSTPDVPACLASIDIFVLPSLNEGLSNALMEAMASGCCAIASRVGGNPELISEGVSGLLFTSRSRGELASRLAETIDDPALRTRLAAGGVERMRAGFSLEASVARMQQIYEATLPLSAKAVQG